MAQANENGDVILLVSSGNSRSEVNVTASLQTEFGDAVEVCKPEQYAQKLTEMRSGGRRVVAIVVEGNGSPMESQRSFREIAQAGMKNGVRHFTWLHPQATQQEIEQNDALIRADKPNKAEITVLIETLRPLVRTKIKSLHRDKPAAAPVLAAAPAARPAPPAAPTPPPPTVVVRPTPPPTTPPAAVALVQEGQPTADGAMPVALPAAIVEAFALDPRLVPNDRRIIAAIQVNELLSDRQLALAQGELIRRRAGNPQAELAQVLQDLFGLEAGVAKSMISSAPSTPNPELSSLRFFSKELMSLLGGENAYWQQRAEVDPRNQMGDIALAERLVELGRLDQQKTYEAIASCQGVGCQYVPVPVAARNWGVPSDFRPRTPWLPAFLSKQPANDDSGHQAAFFVPPTATSGDVARAHQEAREAACSMLKVAADLVKVVALVLPTQLWQSIAGQKAKPRQIGQAEPRPEPVNKLGAVSLDERNISSEVFGVFQRLLQDALKIRGISDIHLVQASDGLIDVQYRVDGAILRAWRLPEAIACRIVSAIKHTLGMDDARAHGKPRHAQRAVNWPEGGRSVSLRISTMPNGARAGVDSMSIRIQKGGEAVPPSALGLSETMMSIVDKLMRSKNGVVLLVGGTGSGKSTTAASMMTLQVNGQRAVSFEHPIEIVMPGVQQTQVTDAMPWEVVVDEVLRSDAQRIYIGEARESKVMKQIAEGAQTDHLILSTVHAASAAEGIERMRDLLLSAGVPIELVNKKIAATMNGLIAQKLVRQPCPCCSTKRPPNSEEAIFLRMHLSDLDDAAISRLELTAAGGRQADGSECGECHGTGYSGRTALHEVLPGTQVTREAIASGASARVLAGLAVSHHGLPTMAIDGIGKAISGLTTIAELIRQLGDKPPLAGVQMTLNQAIAANNMSPAALRASLEKQAPAGLIEESQTPDHLEKIAALGGQIGALQALLDEQSKALRESRDESGQQSKKLAEQAALIDALRQQIETMQETIDNLKQAPSRLLGVDGQPMKKE